MPRLPPDRRNGWTGLRSALSFALLACLGAAPPAPAATMFSGIGTVEYERGTGNLGAGTYSLHKVVLRQDDGTRISADDVSVSGADGNLDDSHWELRGNVRVEYRGSVLDAVAAAVVFAGGRVMTVKVQGGPDEPAQFEHTVKATGRRSQGRAADIAYDAASGQVEFFNGTWFSDGRAEYRDDYISYNVNTTAISNIGNPGTRGTLRLLPKDAERVPPPREPERSTAQ